MSLLTTRSNPSRLAMMRIRPWLTLGVALVLCATVSGAAQAYAPQFSVRSLDGGSISNDSFSGSVVLVQFWATWCPYCRRDQAGIDRIERNYSDKGLSVLAVDVGESPEKVRAYLQANPRACQIALDPDESMAAEFGARAFPHYVLIDRRGKVAATMHGSGGEDALQRLIERSGVFSNGDRPRPRRR